MKGCVLYGRFVFANDEKNVRQRRKRTRSDDSTPSLDIGANDDAEK